MRTRAERRHNDWKKAKHKWQVDLDTTITWTNPSRVADESYCYDNRYILLYNNLHQYSKNKIHCSCGMCSCYNKTKNKGKRRGIIGNYAPSYNWSHADQKKIDELNYTEEE